MPSNTLSVMGLRKVCFFSLHLPTKGGAACDPAFPFAGLVDKVLLPQLEDAWRDPLDLPAPHSG